MKKTLLILATIGVVLALIVGAVIVAVDVEKYRGKIVEAFSQKIGRTVTLKGPMHLGLSWNGVVLSVRDASISNPAWASRPNLAGIGGFRIGVALLPLLRHHLVITELEITDADIQLEIKGDDHNWDMTLAPSGDAKNELAEETPATPTTLHVDKVLIEDSQVAFREADGKLTVFKTKSLTLDMAAKGVAMHFIGDYNAMPIKLDMKTGAADWTAKGLWPFNVDLLYGGYHLLADGNADFGGKAVDLTTYKVIAGDVTTDLSETHGQLNITWGDVRPALHGTILSDHVNISDFVPNEGTTISSVPSSAPAQDAEPVFSQTSLGLDRLKSMNVALDVGLADVTHGDVTFQHIIGHVTLQDGVLFADPIKIILGNNTATGRFKIDSTKMPIQVGLSVAAPDIDLADVFHLGGMEAFLSGKANMKADLASLGDSAHELASNLGGVVTVVADDGSVSGAAASVLSPGLSAIFAPKGTSALNCLAARFVIANGVMRSNGILADTTVTTVSGNGNIDLGREALNIVLRAKPKLTTVGGLMPPLYVAGTFHDPSFTVDPQDVIQSVSGLVTGRTTDNGVPELQSIDGQNACVYTLDHPTAGQPPSDVMTPGLAGQINKIKKIGGSLLNLLGQ